MAKNIFLFISLTLLSGLNAFALDLHGFVEGAAGVRVADKGKTKHDEYNMLETRFQLKTRYYPEKFLSDKDSEIYFRGDFLLDGYYGAKTAFELRDLYLTFSPFDFMDIKAGRQVFTWGTGDLLFINDLFPKDYISFLTGRDDEYLKASSDGVKFSVYNEIADVDIVAIPFFEPNVTAKGDRVSMFDSFQQGIAGRKSDRDLLEPPHQASNAEYAVRVYKTISSYEAAGYFFHGFYKNPLGYKSEADRQLFYPRLDVYGASLRGPFASGIFSTEAGYYNSREDSDGNNRLIQNSSFKIMAGYEKDMGNDLRLGFQYMYDRILDYSEYLNALMPWDYYWDKDRQTLTLRLTKMNKAQTLIYSMFVFYSPDDEDAYLRPSVTWKRSDKLSFVLGADLFWGEGDITDWGMFQENKNIYLRVRYSF